MASLDVTYKVKRRKLFYRLGILNKFQITKVQLGELISSFKIIFSLESTTRFLKKLEMFTGIIYVPRDRTKMCLYLGKDPIMANIA